MNHDGTLLLVTGFGKREITHGNLTIGNVEAMENGAWTRCDGLWDRLRWARENSPTTQMAPKDAAAVIGVEAATYRAYERAPTTSKSIKIDPQSIITLGRRWKISWQWILSGEGTPFDRELSAIQQKAVAMLEDAPLELQERAVGAIKIMLTGTDS